MLLFTGSFLDIVFGQHLRQETVKKKPPKNGISLSSQVFALRHRPWCHIRSVKNERLECETKVPLGYYSAFYQHLT